MNTFFINDIYDKNNNASYKAKADVIRILKKYFPRIILFDFYRVAIHIGHNRIVMAVKGRFLLTFNLINFRLFQHKIKDGDAVIVSFPFEYRWFEYFAKFIYKKLQILKEQKNVKVIFLLHDLNSIRTPGSSDEDSEIKVLSIGDVIISHNPTMSDWLVSKGIKKEQLVDFILWDYLSNTEIDRPRIDVQKGDTKTVVYAGNLSEWKSSFIYKWNPQYSVFLYGENFESEKMTTNTIEWKGVFDAHAPQVDTNGICFGLVWDGDSPDGLEGAGKYLKINNPHKTGLYLSLGLPIIVNEEASNAGFVKENGIGFTVKSLDEIEDVINNISIDVYNRYKENVKKVSSEVRSGYYVSRAFALAFEKLKISPYN